MFIPWPVSVCRRRRFRIPSLLLSLPFFLQKAENSHGGLGGAFHLSRAIWLATVEDQCDRAGATLRSLRAAYTRAWSKYIYVYSVSLSHKFPSISLSLSWFTFYIGASCGARVGFMWGIVGVARGRAGIRFLIGLWLVCLVF